MQYFQPPTDRCCHLHDNGPGKIFAEQTPWSISCFKKEVNDAAIGARVNMVLTHGFLSS